MTGNVDGLVAFHCLAKEYGQRPSVFVDADDLDTDEERAVDLAAFHAFKIAEKDAAATQEALSDVRSRRRALTGK